MTNGRPAISTHAAFAATSSGGNPAGVVLSDQELPTSQMRTIVRRLHVPTVAFGTAVADSEIKTRMFTRDGEIAACGHAAASVAAESYRRSGGALRRTTTHSPGGSITFALGGSPELPTVTMDLAVRSWRTERVPTRLAGLLAGLVDPDIPMARVDTGLHHVVVAVHDRASLNAMHIEHAEWHRVGRELGADTIGVIACGHDGDVELRDVCAPIGDTEEAASGTTATAVTWHLGQLGIGDRFDISQGVAMGRPSRLRTALTATGAQVSGRVRRIGGEPLEFGEIGDAALS